jgi:DNA-binding Lrp family transcriptional regulator
MLGPTGTSSLVDNKRSQRNGGTAMDDTDVKLCRLLLKNSRISLAVLGKELGLSAPSVFRRLEILQASGVIKRFTAQISASFLHAKPIDVFGTSEAKCPGEIELKLAESDLTERILVADGNLVFVTGLLRNPAEMNSYIAFVKEAAQISQPEFILSEPIEGGDWPATSRPADGAKLTLLDYGILRSLHSNARKSATDIARELRVTPRTVKNHISKMTRDGTVQFTLNWNITKSTGGFASITRILLESGTDRSTYLNSLLKRCGHNIMMLDRPVDRPDMIVCGIWSYTMSQHANLLQQVCLGASVERVFSNSILRVDHFDTWRDQLVVEKTSGRVTETIARESTTSSSRV